MPAGDDPNRLFPLGKPVMFQLSGAPGRPTSACGLDIYRDELLGTAFRGNAFVAEPVNQLVHRLVLAPRGVTFAGSARQRRDEARVSGVDRQLVPAGAGSHGSRRLPVDRRHVPLRD